MPGQIIVVAGNDARGVFPIPERVLAFARTEGREPINPLPKMQANIHRQTAPFTEGEISYSEGINDDLNKFIWLSLDWSPDQDDLFRAYYDAFIQLRLKADRAEENKVYERLQEANQVGAAQALKEAFVILDRTKSTQVAPGLRKRIEDLGESLYQRIGIQMSVARYGEDGPERGAVLDFMDTPLNDRDWLLSEMKRVALISDPERAFKEIHSLLHWEDAGPGGPCRSHSHGETRSGVEENDATKEGLPGR
jgi:hypothetical protein